MLFNLLLLMKFSIKMALLTNTWAHSTWSKTYTCISPMNIYMAITEEWQPLKIQQVQKKELLSTGSSSDHS